MCLLFRRGRSRRMSVQTFADVYKNVLHIAEPSKLDTCNGDIEARILYTPTTIKQNFKKWQNKSKNNSADSNQQINLRLDSENDALTKRTTNNGPAEQIIKIRNRDENFALRGFGFRNFSYSRSCLLDGIKISSNSILSFLFSFIFI